MHATGLLIGIYVIYQCECLFILGIGTIIQNLLFCTFGCCGRAVLQNLSDSTIGMNIAHAQIHIAHSSYFSHALVD